MGNIRRVEVHGDTAEAEEPDDTTDPDTGKSLTGAWVWDAALVLAHWFAHEPAWPAGSFKGLRILELGAGVGLPGFVLAKQGAKVVLSERKGLLPALRRNIARNGLEDQAIAVEMEWGVHEVTVSQTDFSDISRTSKAASTSGRADAVRNLDIVTTSGGKHDPASEVSRPSSATLSDATFPSGGSGRLQEALAEIERESAKVLDTQELLVSAQEVPKIRQASLEETPRGADDRKEEDSRSTVARTSEAKDKQAHVASSGLEADRGGLIPDETESDGRDSFSHRAYDIIVGADIMYDVDSMDDLGKTLRHFMGAATKVYICVELRPPLPECFRILSSHGLSWEAIPSSKLHPEWNSEDIRIFQLFLRDTASEKL